MAGPGTDGQLAIIPYVAQRSPLHVLTDTLPGCQMGMIVKAVTFSQLGGHSFLLSPTRLRRF